MSGVAERLCGCPLVDRSLSAGSVLLAGGSHVARRKQTNGFWPSRRFQRCLGAVKGFLQMGLLALSECLQTRGIAALGVEFSQGRERPAKMAAMPQAVALDQANFRRIALTKSS